MKKLIKELGIGEEEVAISDQFDDKLADTFYEIAKKFNLLQSEVLKVIYNMDNK